MPAILPKRREKSGKLQRPSKAQMEAIQKQREEAEMSVVLSQPHRKGNRDQRCENALGRFIIRMKLRDELYTAGEEFATLTRSWRAAKGVPAQLTRGPLGTGTGPSDKTVAEWGRKLIRVQAAMIENTPEGWLQVRKLCLDDIDVDALGEGFAIDGLMVLARELGQISTGDMHPFSNRV